MSGGTKTDLEASEVSAQLELAAARNDAAIALIAAHRYVAAGLAMRICAPDFVAERPAVTQAFGRTFAAKFGGRCVICEQPIMKGAPAVYRASDRGIAHQACGAGR